MKKYYKIINTSTKETAFVTASSMEHVEAWVIKNMPNWYFGMNVVEVNADKTRKAGGDFSCIAFKRYFTDMFNTEDENKILNIVYSQIVKGIKSK